MLLLTHPLSWGLTQYQIKEGYQWIVELSQDMVQAFKKKGTLFSLVTVVQTDLERETLDYPIYSVAEPHET